MPLSLAAAIFTILIVCVGIVSIKLNNTREAGKKLEKLLEDSRRELASLEVLESRFLNRIGEVLAAPLMTIEASSSSLSSVDVNIPDNIRRDLHDLSEEVKSLIRILSVFEEIPTKTDELNPDTDSLTETEIVQMDDVVSLAAMEITEGAADKLVSLSVAICGTVNVIGKKAQLIETVSSILREGLKRSDPASVMTVELRTERNMELEVSWFCEKDQISEDQNLLGAGFIRLVASTHGGWLNVDMEHRRITLILPLAGDNK